MVTTAGTTMPDQYNDRCVVDYEGRPVRTASRSARAWAAVTDWSLLIVLLAPQWVWMWLLSFGNLRPPPFIVCTHAAAFLIVFGPELLRGRTAGKWLLGLRVVGPDQGNATRLRAAVRWMFKHLYILPAIAAVFVQSDVLSGAALWLGIVWCLLLCNGVVTPRRAIHDRVAETRVVRD